MTQNSDTKALAKKYGMTEKKVLRIKKAVRLHYGKDMKHKDILEEFDNLSRRQTITEYLNHDVADEFKAPYSAKETYEIQKEFEENFEDLEEDAKKLFKEAREAGTFDQRIKALKELRKVNKDVAEFASQIGALETEAEKHEVEHSGVPAVQIITGESEASGEPDVTTGDEE